MVSRTRHCLNLNFYEIGIVVKILLKIVRRKDPVELYYNLYILYIYIYTIYIFW